MKAFIFKLVHQDPVLQFYNCSLNGLRQHSLEGQVGRQTGLTRSRSPEPNRQLQPVRQVSWMLAAASKLRLLRADRSESRDDSLRPHPALRAGSLQQHGDDDSQIPGELQAPRQEAADASLPLRRQIVSGRRRNTTSSWRHGRIHPAFRARSGPGSDPGGI